MTSDQPFQQESGGDSGSGEASVAAAPSAPEPELGFHAIADSIDQMIWSTLPDGRHDYFNRRWYEYVGRPEGSTGGEEWNDMFHPDDRERAWARWRQSLQTGEPYEIEYRLRHCSGEYRWVLGRAHPVRGADGAILRWYGTCTDIHDLKLAEEKQRHSEERLQRALDAGEIGDYEWDLRTGEINWSHNLMRIVGLPADTSVDGDTVWNLIHPDDKERTRIAVEQAVASGDQLDISYRVVGADGRIRWIASRGRVERDRTGAPARLVGVNFDITASHEAEERLRETQTRLQTLTDNLPGVVVYQVVTSRDMSERSYIHVSASAERVLGVSAEAAMRDPHVLMERIDPTQLDAVLAAEREAAAKLETLDIELRGRTAGGDIRTRIISRPRELPDGRLVWDGMVIDISERRRAQEEAERSAALLRAIGDATPDLIFAKDLDLRLLYANAATCRTIGVAPEQVVGLSNLDLATDAEEGAAIDANDTRVLQSGRTQVLDELFTSPDGKSRVFRTVKTPMRDAAGTVIGLVGVGTDISDRVEAEERLRQSEARLRGIFEATPDCIKIVAPDGALMQMNQAGLCMIEAPEAEAVAGAKVFDLISSEYREEWKARHARIVAGESMNWEFEITGLEGTRRRMETHAVPLPLPDGSNAQLAVTRDITRRREVEDALRESEQRFRLLADTAPALIWMSDAEANITFANRWYYETFGRPPEEMLGDGWKAIVHPDDLEPFLAGFMAAFERRGLYQAEVRVFDSLGAIRWLSCQGSPRFDPGGRFLGYTGVNLDVTGRRAVEDALRDSEERFRTLADNIPTLCWWADASGYIYWYNRLWYDYTGTAPSDMEGWGWQSVHDPDVLPSVMERWTASIATGQPFEMTFPLRSAAGEFRPFLTRIVPLRDETGTVVRWFGTNTDIAEVKQLEAALRELNETLEQRVAEEVAQRAQAEEALRQAQKMETLGQLTGGVAHDFNNLLQIVSGNIGLIQRNLKEGDDRLRRAADNAARGAERAAVLTQRLLAFSRRQPLAPKPTDPNRLVGSMSELLHRTLGETIEVEAVLASGLWNVEVDPHQLENALLNLAINARDAMDGGGKLTIETANTHLDRAYVSQAAEVAPGQYVAICVSDTGCGMDADTVARAFEPFFTTKEVGKGTGLGLSMVYGFVKQSGGHLKIYSEPGHGTTVKIYLPRLHGDRQEAEEVDSRPAPEGTQNETILVCEDDDDVRAYTVEVLRELGYRVLEAHDGPSALRLLERQEGRVDLLFTDIVLPSGMTGAVLAKQAQALRPGLKVLFTTGYARNAIVHHGRVDPGVKLITKPFSYSDLAARVREMLDGVAGA